MNCERFRQQLCGWLDGELPLVDRLEAEAHARECGACGGLAGSCRVLIDSYRRQPAAPLPTGVHRRVMQRLGLQPSGHGPNLMA